MEYYTIVFFFPTLDTTIEWHVTAVTVMITSLQIEHSISRSLSWEQYIIIAFAGNRWESTPDNLLPGYIIIISISSLKRCKEGKRISTLSCFQATGRGRYLNIIPARTCLTIHCKFASRLRVEMREPTCFKPSKRYLALYIRICIRWL